MSASIFISYSRDDEKSALHLLGVLRAAGYEVWIDQEAIAGATIWSDEIVRNIKSCKIFIALISNSSVSSANVGKEIALAAENGKIILPVVIGQVTLPGRLEYALAGIQRTSIHEEDAILHAVKSQMELGAGSAKGDVHKRRKQKRMMLIGAGATALAIAIVAIILIRTRPAAQVENNRIVVLPFATLNLDKDSTHNLDIFSDGLVNRFATDRFLAASSASVATSYRTSSLASMSIAKELGVRFIIEGQVRKDHDVQFVSARLFDSRRGGEVWERWYSGGERELFAIRERMSDDLAGYLSGTISTELDLKQLEEKVAANPKDAESMTKLAMKLVGIDKPRSLELYSKLIQLDSSNEINYISAGVAAERMKSGSLARDYGKLACLAIEKKRAVNPTDMNLATSYALALDMAGRPEPSEHLYDSLLLLKPTDVRLLYNAACCYAKDGKTDKSLDLLERLFPIAPGKRSEAQSDPDFDNLRNVQRYSTLMYPTRQNGTIGS